jgi:hypothetical protein
MGIDIVGLINYHDLTNGTLEMAHCSDLFCVPPNRLR